MAVPVIALGSQPPAAALPDGAALPAGPLAAGLDAPPDGDGLVELLLQRCEQEDGRDRQGEQLGTHGNLHPVPR